MKSDLSTNGAYELATNWLTHLGIDIPALELRSGHKITQRSFLKNPPNAAEPSAMGRSVVSLPVFDIEWGNKEVGSQTASYPMPLLVVTVFGPTRELIEMHITDDAVVGGAKQPVKDVEKLLAIVDATFLGYNELQKGDLVAGYATNLQPSNPIEKPGLKP